MADIGENKWHHDKIRRSNVYDDYAKGTFNDQSVHYSFFYDDECHLDLLISPKMILEQPQLEQDFLFINSEDSTWNLRAPVIETIEFGGYYWNPDRYTKIYLRKDRKALAVVNRVAILVFHKNGAGLAKSYLAGKKLPDAES